MLSRWTRKVTKRLTRLSEAFRWSTGDQERTGTVWMICAILVCTGSCTSSETNGSRSPKQPNADQTTVSSPDSSTAPSASNIPAALLQSGVPELALRPSPQEEGALYAAVDAEIEHCMEAKGFAFFHPTASDYAKGAQERNAEYGRQFPRGDPRDVPTALTSVASENDPNAGYLGSLDAAAQAAWRAALSGDGEVRQIETSLGAFGFPTSGCRADAYTKFYATDGVEVRVAETYIGNIELATHQQTLVDRDVLEAQGTWSECLTAYGFDYTSFGSARYAELPKDQKTTLDDFDTRCARSSGLTEIYRKAFNRNFLAAYELDRGLIDGFAAARSEAIKRVGGG